MVVILKIIQVILALSLLVLVHEFGHFIFAKIFRIRVEKFYLFFPPALLRFKPKGGETEFGIGMIPLGGFCKISGMVDESLDTKGLKNPPQKWEFRSRPAWQRLLVMSGGVLMNFITAAIIYSLSLFTWGEEYLRTEDAVYGIEVNSLSMEMGFCNGDILLQFDSNPLPENFSELQMYLIRDKVKQVTLLRQGDTVNIEIDDAYIPAMLNTPGIFSLRAPLAIREIPDSSINFESGLKAGDSFMSINGAECRFFDQLHNELGKYSNSTAPLCVMRDSAIMTIPVAVNNEGKIEVFLQYDIKDFNITRKEYSLLSSIPAGIELMYTSVTNYIKELGLIFTPKTQAYKSVGSFIAIGNVFPDTWNWRIFWNITAMLSVMLGIMNLLPIPALDGGHILFTLFEIVTRKKPSDRFMEIAQVLGMVLLLAIMFLAIGNDFIKLLK
ncbi:MAG: RIP metalloprotease RseP [Candidatus Coprenecus sp.]